MGLKISFNFAQGPREEYIVRIHPANNFSGGIFQAFVDRVSLAAVLTC